MFWTSWGFFQCWNFWFVRPGMQNIPSLSIFQTGLPILENSFFSKIFMMMTTVCPLSLYLLFISILQQTGSFHHDLTQNTGSLHLLRAGLLIFHFFPMLSLIDPTAAITYSGSFCILAWGLSKLDHPQWKTLICTYILQEGFRGIFEALSWIQLVH